MSVFAVARRRRRAGHFGLQLLEVNTVGILVAFGRTTDTREAQMSVAIAVPMVLVPAVFHDFGEITGVCEVGGILCDALYNK